MTSGRFDQRKGSGPSPVAPPDELDSALAAALRANAAVLFALGEPTGCLYGRAGAHMVLFRYGMSLEDALRAAEAEDFYRALTEATTRHLGRDRWCTLVTRQCAAQAALAAYAGLADDMTRVLGAEHPDTRAVLSEAAAWREAQAPG